MRYSHLGRVLTYFPESWAACIRAICQGFAFSSTRSHGHKTRSDNFGYERLWRGPTPNLQANKRAHPRGRGNPHGANRAPRRTDVKVNGRPVSPWEAIAAG